MSAPVHTVDKSSANGYAPEAKEATPGLEAAAERIAQVAASGWGRVEVIIQDHRVTEIKATITDKL